MATVRWRLLALGLLSRLKNKTHSHDREKVAIYGAGAAGVQLMSALRHSTEAKPAFFLDDNPSLHGAVIASVPV